MCSPASPAPWHEPVPPTPPGRACPRYYTARLRAALGTAKLIIANVPAPSVADPSLNGITIEFEHCAGDESPHAALRAGAAGAGVGGTAGPAAIVDAEDVPAFRRAAARARSFSLNAACTQTLLGQKALSDLSGRESVFALWLTHSEVVPAALQCAELAGVQGALPWVREGDDITDCTRETGPASCVRCNTSAPLAV